MSPTLKLLFSAEEIQDLTRTYTALSSSTSPPIETDADGVEGDGQDNSAEDEEESL